MPPAPSFPGRTHSMTRLLLACSATLARLLPGRLAYALARAVSALFWAADDARRQAVRANLARVAPERTPAEREALARRMFATFAESVVDAWRTGEVTIEGGERLTDALAEGHGVLLWSAHLGNWELAAEALARSGLDVSALARAHTDKDLEHYMDDRRRAAGVRIVGRCPLGREARRVLRAHGLLALLGDRRFGVGGRAVPFFGTLARLPAAPIALARRTGAALVPGFVVRTAPGRYRVQLEPPVPTTTGRALEALAAVLERYVRAHPEQWFVFEPVWDESA